MNLTMLLLEALETLSSNKLRSGLTVLGIVIGVAAVIAMLAVGNGATASITGSINSVGTNLLFVFRGARNNPDVVNPRPLTMSDSNALLDPYAAPHVQAVAPVVQGNGTAEFGGTSKTTTIAGVTAPYKEVRNVTLLDGSFISDQDNLGRTSVVVIGVDVADSLFGHRDGLIGETIRLNGQPFRIIGVLSPQGGSAFGSADNQVIVPLTTAQARLIHNNAGPDAVEVVYIQATDYGSVPAASDEVSQILRTRHRTAIGADDFTVFTQESILSTVQSVTGVLTIFLGGIAAISLLVGGIGIMNIMLVSVTERTREIGLRKALGARRRDILVQFLVESSLLSLIGGLVGILFGWLIAFVVGRVAAATGNNFTPIVGFNAVALATLFSAAVGLFFGIYPANRAAGLEPVEALRYE
ncbi:MAG TPA: ABC transporter permease [Anaerolineales bacterium]|nr:ABC transporter permease [Anaerolineales bacterium]